MRKKVPGLLWVALLWGAAVCAALLPGERETAAPWPFLVLLSAVPVVCGWRWIRGRCSQAVLDVSGLTLALLLLWELLTTRWGLLNPITFPTPEAVCMSLYLQRWALLRGIGSSLSLLLVGFVIALPAGTLLGMAVGWVPRLRGCLYPVARVISPIPPSIYSSYVVAIMPSFRSASAAILVLGLFWPVLLNVIGRVGSVERPLLDSAAVLCLGKREMMLKILLPYLLPGLVSSLHVQLSTSFLLLTLAEMMGAASGLGYFVKLNADYANYANVVAGIAVTGGVVTLLNAGISAAERRLLVWKG